MKKNKIPSIAVELHNKIVDGLKQENEYYRKEWFATRERLEDIELKLIPSRFIGFVLGGIALIELLVYLKVL